MGSKLQDLWKNTKRRATHNRYFPEFDTLMTSVLDTLIYFQHHPDEVKHLMGVYCETELTAIPEAAGL